MKTVYLPDTHIDPRRAEQMATVWGRLTVLQPSVETCLPDMESLQEAGIIKMVFPASETQDSLNDVLQELKQWAAQHTGGDLAAMIEQGQAIPFFNSQSSAQIVAEIRKKGQAQVADSATDDRNHLFQARLFLAMAQEFDIQQAALMRDIETLNAKENEMMALLKGEAVFDTPSSMVSTRDAKVADLDPSMIVLRLKAWARAMAAVEGMETLSGKEAEILFLTAGRGVLRQIQDIFPEAETWLQGYRPMSDRPPVDALDRLPSWLASPLRADSGKASDIDDGQPPGFDLLEIPDTSVAVFLLRLSGQAGREGSDRVSRASAGSCWIGCMNQANDDAVELVSA